MQNLQNPRSLRSRYIGDRAFYKMVFAVVLPIIIQNTVANFVNLLDNVMVGRIGTEQMSGVSIANQLLFVFNLCIFGGLSGSGIFTAQFYGAKDTDGVRYTFRFKLYTILLVLIVFYTVFAAAGSDLIKLYLTEDESGDINATLDYGRQYLQILFFGIAPFALSQCYASTLREVGETMMPMKASVAEVCTNLVLNYVLIYGKLGAPVLGVRGAAIATVVSRFVGLAILIVYTHLNKERYPFIRGAYSSPKIPRRLVGDIIRKGMPLLANEAIWSFGTTSLIQQYSMRGMIVIASLNISSTLSNMFSVLFMSTGTAVAILVGQALGADDIEGAKDNVRKLVVLSVLFAVVFGGLLAVTSPYLPLLYNTEAGVHQLATSLLLCCALIMPINALNHNFYFTLRAGGKTVITFFYDCGFSCAVMLPLAHLLVTRTSLSVIAIYLIVQGSELIKAFIGYILVRKGVWIHNIVSSN